jgi:hypothetical protein
MTRGRPATPVGTFGEIGTAQLDSGKWLANVTVRLPPGRGSGSGAPGKAKRKRNAG